jgi:Low molecular weight phosphotyrosine protein phosphatase
MYTFGIVCSGNTCRSPIAAAWLRQVMAMRPPTQVVQIWTAGMAIERQTDIGTKPIEPEPLLVAEYMGLPDSEFESLRQHRVRDLRSEERLTDLLAWITDPSKLFIKTNDGLTRAEYMRQRAKALDATLLVIPEADHAWQAKKDGAPEKEVLAQYRKQAESLRQWSLILYGFIPS